MRYIFVEKSDSTAIIWIIASASFLPLIFGSRFQSDDKDVDDDNAEHQYLDG